MTKTLLIFLIAGASQSLSGCATTEPNDPWSTAEVTVDQASPPPDCGSFPLPAASTGDLITYDKAGVNALEDYRVCAETNQAVAAERTAAVNDYRAAAGHLIAAGKAEHRLAEIRSQIIEEERRARFWERIQYWFLIGVLGAAAL